MRLVCHSHVSHLLSGGFRWIYLLLLLLLLFTPYSSFSSFFGIRTHYIIIYIICQQETGFSKQPIRTRYLGHVTGFQPIRDQHLLVRSVPNLHLLLTSLGWWSGSMLRGTRCLGASTALLLQPSSHLSGVVISEGVVISYTW